MLRERVNHGLSGASQLVTSEKPTTG
jgi:hypothetical protein